MNVLCIGDVVGKPGRVAINELLGSIKEEYKIDAVVINAENAAGGSGLTRKIAEEILSLDCDVITLGDHVWDQKEIEEYLQETDRVIRPANFPEGAPGKGYTIVSTASGVKIAVVNVLGRVFMRYNVTCPFRALENIIEEIGDQASVIIVDMHAETTSEKVAMGYFLDGKVSVLFGTHTHIQTADEVVLPKGTAYITDLGMTGPYDSVIGQNKDHIIKRFYTSMPVRFAVAQDNVKICGIIVDVDENTGKAKNIKRLAQRYEAVNQKTKE